MTERTPFAFVPPYRAIAVVAGVVAAVQLATRVSTAQSAGEAVYRERCAGCHEQVSPRIPHRDALQKMPASRILRTLDFGAMMNIAYPLRRDERAAVAAFLGTSGGDPTPPAAAYCADRAVKVAARPKSQWNGWSPSTGNNRIQPPDAPAMTGD